jgi:hypothetical protein
MTRILIAAVCVVSFGRCTEPERLASSPTIDPRRTNSIAVALNPVPLTPIVLLTPADYDRWEHTNITRYGAGRVFEMYRNAIVEQIISKSQARYLFMRWLMVTFHERVSNQQRNYVRSIVAGLVNRATAFGPDFQYVLGLMHWHDLVGGPKQPPVPLSIHNPVAIEPIVKNWSELASANPNWVGPYGLTTRDLMTRVKTLQDSLKYASPAALTKERNAPGFKPAAPIEATEKKRQDALISYYLRYTDQEPPIPNQFCLELMGAAHTSGNPVLFGDAYANCLLRTGRYLSAVKQIKGMLQKQVPGGVTALLSQLAALQEWRHSAKALAERWLKPNRNDDADSIALPKLIVRLGKDDRAGLENDVKQAIREVAALKKRLNLELPEVWAKIKRLVTTAPAYARRIGADGSLKAPTKKTP